MFKIEAIVYVYAVLCPIIKSRIFSDRQYIAYINFDRPVIDNKIYVYKILNTGASYKTVEELHYNIVLKII